MSKKDIIRNINKMRDYGFEDDPDTEIKSCETCVYYIGKIFRLKHYTDDDLKRFESIFESIDIEEKLKNQIDCGYKCINCDEITHNNWIQIEGK